MLFQVIARARRRLLWNALALQVALAAVAALGALVMLLLLGTDVVAWWWLIVLPGATLAAGTVAALRRWPGTCSTAQLLDRRLQLADTLSTAAFFSQAQAGATRDEFRRAQNAQATRIAESIDVRNAIPMRMPRAVYVSAALAIAATGLFVVRYRSDARLDLRAPVAAIVQQLLEETRQEVAKLVDEFLQPRQPERSEAQEARNRPPEADGENTDGNPASTNESNATGSGNTGEAEKSEEKAKTDTFAGEQEQSQQGTSSSAEARSGSQQDSSSQQTNQGNPQRQQSASGSQSASTSASSSMANKIKNSMANLLSALNPQQGKSGGQQAKTQDGNQAGKNGKRGETDSASASGEPGEGDSTQPGDAKPGGTGHADLAEADARKGTGAGRDEGSKEIKTAAQLEAMGKLGSIFGKRAEALSGEFTVESSPGAQSLRTPYAQRSAEHTSAETVAMRDEVPVAYQEYIQHYYELIRQANATPRRSDGVMAGSIRRPRPVR